MNEKLSKRALSRSLLKSERTFYITLVIAGWKNFSGQKWWIFVYKIVVFLWILFTNSCGHDCPLELVFWGEISWAILEWIFVETFHKFWWTLLEWIYVDIFKVNSSIIRLILLPRKYFITKLNQNQTKPNVQNTWWKFIESTFENGMCVIF